MDVYRKTKRIYANGRRRPMFKGEEKKKIAKSLADGEGMPPPKIRRSSSRRSDLSFQSVEEIEEGLRKMDAHLKDEFDYKLL